MHHYFSLLSFVGYDWNWAVILFGAMVIGVFVERS